LLYVPGGEPGKLDKALSRGADGLLVDLADCPGRAEGSGRAAEAKPKVVYNLNPFDQGATRDLGRPKAIEPPRSSDPPAAPGGPPKAPTESEPPSPAAR